MGKKNTRTKTLTITLVAYCILIVGWAWLNEAELMDRAICCGLYGDYQRYYLPFPIITTSELSHWGGGPTRINLVEILLNVFIPLTIGFVAIALSRLGRFLAKGKPNDERRPT